MSQIIDKFFNLGNKATNGDPVRKAQFDYSLYWVVFTTFIGLAINYFRIFATTGNVGSLFWGLIICAFSWFNYWALIAFRQSYINIKKFYQKKEEPEVKSSVEDAFTD